MVVEVRVFVREAEGVHNQSRVEALRGAGTAMKSRDYYYYYSITGMTLCVAYVVCRVCMFVGRSVGCVCVHVFAACIV